MRRYPNLFSDCLLSRRGAGTAQTFTGLESLEDRVMLNNGELRWVFTNSTPRISGGKFVLDVAPQAMLQFGIKPASIQAYDFPGGHLQGYNFNFDFSPELWIYQWGAAQQFTQGDATLDTEQGDDVVSSSGANFTGTGNIGTFAIWAPSAVGTYEFSLNAAETKLFSNFGPIPSSGGPTPDGSLTLPLAVQINVLEGVEFESFIDLKSEPSTYVAGDTIDFRIDLLNPTNQAVTAKGTYDAYISTEEEFDPATAIQVVSDAKFNYKFAPGQMLGVDLNFKVPVEADKGDYRVFGAFTFEDPTQSVSGEGYSQTSETVHIKRAFGALMDRDKPVSKLLFEDESGVNGTLSISGGGKGFFRVDDSGFTSLRILESTAETKVTLKWEKGQVGTLGSVRSTQSLGYLDLGNSSVRGTLDFEGGIGGLRVQYLFDQHQINIGGAAADGPVAIKFGQFGDVKINSARPIKSLTGEQWLDLGGETDQIVAPWVETVAIKGNKKLGLRGDFEADIITSDATVELKKLTVAGLLKGARIQTAGNLKSVTVGAMEGSQLFAGVIGATLPDDAADFSEFALGSVTVKGITGLGQATFVNSSLAAANIGTVKLKDVNEGDGNGEDFGLAAKTIKSLQRLDQAGLVKLSNLDAPGDADADPNDDFVIRVF